MYKLMILCIFLFILGCSYATGDVKPNYCGFTFENLTDSPATFTFVRDGHKGRTVPVRPHTAESGLERYLDPDYWENANWGFSIQSDDAVCVIPQKVPGYTTYEIILQSETTCIYHSIDKC